MRVAITGSDDRFDSIAPVFARRSLEPIRLSSIAVRPAANDVLIATREVAERVGRVMVSSARAVEMLWEGRETAAEFFTVGRATSTAVSQRGGRILIEGAAGLELLCRRVAMAGVEQLVFPHAAGTDLAALRPLADAGVDVIEQAVYETEPIAPADDPVDAVAFASPSAVAGWMSARSVDGLVVAAIGSTTAAALERLDVRVDVIPERPGFVELAEALANADCTTLRTREEIR